MKIRWVVLVMSVLILIMPTIEICATEFDFTAESIILMEAETGTVLYEKNADTPLPPASVTKIMTLLLIMEALDQGRFELTDKVNISENAANMGGSQVYLEAGEQMCVDELIKCVVVASANDAAAALAEFCCGSEEAFVEQMNLRAKELGMINTHFENTNGLDDTTTAHLMSARDIAIMSRELLKHKKIFDYTNIWMDTIRDGSFGLTNTNRLIRFYKGANGLKTGSTSKAGFCISATAKRDDMQLIAVIMASPTRDDRNSTAVKLLDYGFSQYAFYQDTGKELDNTTISVKKGLVDTVTIAVADPIKKLINKTDKGKIEKTITLYDNLQAPVEKGQKVGQILYTLNGENIGSVDILAQNSVEKIKFTELFKIALKNLAII